MSPPSPDSTIFAQPASSSFSISIGLERPVAMALLFLVFLISFFILYCCVVHCVGRNRNHNTSGGVRPRIANNQGAGNGNDDANNNENVVIVSSGLPENIINTYPKVVFDNDFIIAAANNINPTCSICLSEYKLSEMLRMMPECRHYFHVNCVDEWLRVNGSCPVCRSELAAVSN